MSTEPAESRPTPRVITRGRRATVWVDHRSLGGLFKIGTLLERIMRRNSLLAILLLLLSASFSMGQFDTSAVLGFVRDSSGAPIAGSNVTLVNLATRVTLATTTDGNGQF